MDKPAGTGTGRWHDIALTTAALLYRLSWPWIDAHATAPHRPALYSLSSKFFFTFISLACLVRVLRAVLRARRRPSSSSSSSGSAPTSIACRSRDDGDGGGGVAALDRFLRCLGTALCLLVTSVNAVAGWRWAWVAVDEYFTRGLGLAERSWFHRGALVGCEGLLSVAVVVVMGVCWVGVGGEWWAAGRKWWSGRGEGEGVEREDRKSGRGETEKLRLGGMSGLKGNIGDRKS